MFDTLEYSWSAESNRGSRRFFVIIFPPLLGVAVLARLIFSTIFIVFVKPALAQSTPSTQEITMGVITAATNYVDAIACSEDKIEAKNVASLIPYKRATNPPNGKFAVLWSGDIGCVGGTGTSGAHISIVTVGSADTYMVDPHLSSPIVSFESPIRFVERIVGNTKDTLTLEGKEYGPNDANCCPSMSVRFILRADNKGNWRMIDKRVTSTKR